MRKPPRKGKGKVALIGPKVDLQLVVVPPMSGSGITLIRGCVAHQDKKIKVIQNHQPKSWNKKVFSSGSSRPGEPSGWSRMVG
jgi:hypothetical protein